MKNEEIISRLGKLEALRANVQDTWDEIERYIAPYRGKFFRDDRSELEAEWRRPYVYDSTAISASQSLAASLHSSLTSPKVKWFDLRFRDQELNDRPEAVKWLDAVSDIIYKTLQDSNFTVQAGETYQDLVDFGTSVITEEAESEENWQGINFVSVPLKEAYFEQDYKGNIQNFYRKIQMTAVQLVSKFGTDVPDWVNEWAADPEKATRRISVVFCIFRRTSIDATTINLHRPIPPDQRPYGFRWMTFDSKEPLGQDGGYYEMPAYVPRWRTTSGSMWGNSPAMVALSDTITLNKLVEMLIGAMEKVIDPATITTERGLLGDLNLNAGGLTVVRSLDDIKPFESAARFDVSYQEIQRYRDQIREYFMIDQLMLPPMQGTPATATEIAARISQLERLIGPTLGRLQTDFLDPCISRTFNILMRAGQFPAPPDIVTDSPSGLDIEYVGALARSQQQDQVNSVERWLMTLTQVGQITPEVLDVPDWTELTRGMGFALGVPARFMRSKADVKRIRDQREQQQQAMIEAQIAETQGNAMKAETEASQ